jgi:hypothetical protein
LPLNHYHFVSKWRVLGSIEEVFGLISDAKALPSWWPAAFPEVLEIQPGDENGLDKVVRFETRGWLPMSLLWHATTVEVDPPRRFKIEAWGDLSGTGEWRLESDGPWVNVTYEWDVQANKAVLRYLSPLLRPLFSSSHNWVMAKGETSLRLELAKRHAATAGERASLPAPPRPVQVPAAPIIGVLAIATLLLLRQRSGRRA